MAWKDFSGRIKVVLDRIAHVLTRFIHSTVLYANVLSIIFFCILILLIFKQLLIRSTVSSIGEVCSTMAYLTSTLESRKRYLLTQLVLLGSKERLQVGLMSTRVLGSTSALATSALVTNLLGNFRPWVLRLRVFRPRDLRPSVLYPIHQSSTFV